MGLLASSVDGCQVGDVLATLELQLIEGTSKYCMTTAFTLWCHLGALTSVRMSNNLFFLKMNYYHY